MSDMYKTGELEEVMKSFEKNAGSIGLYGRRFDRERREIGKPFAHGAYYQDGETNTAFRAYLAGYALGKCIGRL